MIKKELEEVLRERKFNEEKVRDILSKDIPFSLIRCNKEKLERNINIFQKNGFSDDRIIDSIATIAKGGAETIENNIQVLRKYNISEEIIKSRISLLIDGNTAELEKILIFLNESRMSKEAIETCIYIASTKGFENVSRIMYVMKKYNISKEAIETSFVQALRYCSNKTQELDELLWFLHKKEIPHKMIEENIAEIVLKDYSTVKSNFRILEENEISIEQIKDNFVRVLQVKPEQLEKTFKVIEKYNVNKETKDIMLQRILNTRKNDVAERMEDLIKALNEIGIDINELKGHSTLLKNGDGTRIRELIKVLKSSENGISDEAIKNTLSIFEANPQDVQEKLKILHNHKISKGAIEKCLTVLIKSDKDNLENIFCLLEQNGVKKNEIEGCLSVLTLSDSREIEKIFKVLKENNINKNKINKCLSLLVCGKEERIRENIEILKKFGISNNLVENCLSSIAKSSSVNLYKMLEILTQNNVEENVIANSLSVLKDGSPTEIYEVFKVLKENEIGPDLVNKYYSVKLFKKSAYVKDIFSDKPVYIKQYLKFKKKYNQILSKKEILEICKEKNSTIEEFLIQADDKSTYETALKTLKQKGNLYIGDYIPMAKEDVDKYADLLLRLSKGITASFIKKSKYKDFDDMEDFVMDTLLTRCGNLVYNLEADPEVMHNALFSKCKKYLFLYEKIHDLDILTDFQDSKNQKLGTQKGNVRKEIDLEKWNVNDDDRFVLQMLAQILEEGYCELDAFEIGAQRLNIDVSDFLKKIEKIKSNNEHLQENRSGDER